MKKSFLGIFALSLSMLLASCGGGTSTASSPAEESSSAETATSVSSTETKTSESSSESSKSEESSSSEEAKSSDVTSSKESSNEETTSADTSSEEGSSAEATSESESASSEASSSTVTDEHVVEAKVSGRVITASTLTEEEAKKNLAVYKGVKLTLSDTVTITHNGTALKFYTWDKVADAEVDHGETWTPTREGNHNFWVGIDLKVWVDIPPEPAGPIAVTIDGQSVTATPESDPGDNKAVYKITLNKGQKISFTEDGTELHFYSWDDANNKAIDHGAVYQALATGLHTFYINANSQIYYSAPTPEASTGVLTVYKGDSEITVTNEKPASDTNNKAIYKIELSIGDTITIKEDGVALCLGDSSDSVFTAKKAGVHTFYVNNASKVYVVEP
ncbi:MAG: hypothetical protein K6B65_03755, partial [Bacilli bacterium]|nr:hypothetical protein [Bacilli bacterium]